VSTLEDRLAAALRRLVAPCGDVAQSRADYANARTLLAEYDRSQEVCKCAHNHANHGGYASTHLHTRAHCQPAEPVL
jgi:hypothetical protein